MKKFFSRLQNVDDSILVVAFVIMVLASFSQVVNRNLVHAGISWFEELSRYCMVYMALLAAEAGLRDGTQISITAITDRMKGTFGKIVRIAAKAIVVVCSAVIGFTSLSVLQTQIMSGQRSPGLGVPMVVPYFAFPFSFAIITVIQIVILVRMILDLVHPKKENGEAAV